MFQQKSPGTGRVHPDEVRLSLGISRKALSHLLASVLRLPGVLGASDCSFPPWLKSLMTICCCVNDCSLQNIAIATLLEVINHSQSLALVIEDKMKRYKTSGNNPFFGKLQMVTVPPIAPGILKVIAEKTDFYQVCLPGNTCA